MDQLVFIGKIISLEDIPAADFIVLATVVCGAGGKWRGIVRKSDFAIDDKCMVYLPDSIIPENGDMEFMKATHWRVRMRRFKGVPSEVLIVKYKDGVLPLGTDVTDAAGVIKYVKKVPARLAGVAKGHFPSFIRKTDEPNYQASDDLISLLRGQPYYVTEKADGSSTTAYKWKGEFGVCSRNLDLIESAENGYWQIANRYNLRQSLPEGYALQWETCGPKIQSNPMGLKQIEGFAFSVWDISKQHYLPLYEFTTFCEKLGFPTVKILKIMQEYDEKDLTELARGKYSNGATREGIVVRSSQLIDGRIISFKSINLDYED